jgi:hypothetical protein
VTFDCEQGPYAKHFFVVEFEHVGASQGFADDLTGIERLTEIHIKDSQRIGPGGV